MGRTHLRVASSRKAHYASARHRTKFFPGNTCSPSSMPVFESLIPLTSLLGGGAHAMPSQGCLCFPDQVQVPKVGGASYAGGSSLFQGLPSAKNS